jgi:hypothetical protein
LSRPRNTRASALSSASAVMRRSSLRRCTTDSVKAALCDMLWGPGHVSAGAEGGGFTC